MLDIEFSRQFKKDVALARKRGLDIAVLNDVIMTLRRKEPLEPKFRDHPLKGNYKGYRECHILPDWLLVYKIKDDRITLLAHRTGTHSDLFD